VVTNTGGFALEPAASEMIQIMATAANAVRTDTYQRLPLLLFMPPTIAANLIAGRETLTQHALVPDQLSAHIPTEAHPPGDGWACGANRAI
jgi:hypothetical protein